MRASKGNIWTCVRARFGSLVLVSVMAGCLNLRPLPPAILPNLPEQQPVAAQPPPMRDENLSGALDGPTLRLATRDLAVILDTLGRLEQMRPELKTEMLAELAEADAVTAAAIVRKWRDRLVEVQAAAERVAPSRGEPTHLAVPTVTSGAAVTSAPSPTKHPGFASASHTEPAPIASPLRRAGSTAPRPESTHDKLEKPAELLENQAASRTTGSSEWSESLETLLNHTRDRSESSGPEASRARVQLALLELLKQTELAAGEDRTPDSELWSHLSPAIQYCLATETATEQSADDIIRSLQVATELLRGPRRFQARRLAFCKRVRGFGKIDRVDSPTFTAGQPVLLYCEVEHFFCEPDTAGFRTRLSSTVELLDASGQGVWKQNFAPVEDQSSEPRRDYFLSHRFRLPRNLKPGLYSLRLTLCDELANRTTSSGIGLSVR